MACEARAAREAALCAEWLPGPAEARATLSRIAWAEDILGCDALLDIGFCCIHGDKSIAGSNAVPLLLVLVLAVLLPAVVLLVGELRTEDPDRLELADIDRREDVEQGGLGR